MSDRLEQNLNANSQKNTTKTNLAKWKNDLIFVLTMWGSSRLVIIIAMLAIAKSGAARSRLFSPLLQEELKLNLAGEFSLLGIAFITKK